MTQQAAIQSVLITGAGGNLGRKLTTHLLAGSWCKRLVAVDRLAVPATSDPRLIAIEADLADANDAGWRETVQGIDAIVHLAASNPLPDAPWSDSCVGFDMTLHLLEAAVAAGVRRFVFASSNHTMGQYKDEPLAGTIGPGDLRTDLPPGPGTRFFNGHEIVQGFAYGASKLMGERACCAKANLSDGRFTSVSVRIGWCQPGANDPHTLNTSGLPGEQPGAGAEAERDLRWFRNMWLSDRDYAAVMEGALLADAAGWPAPGIVVNGMSANRGMPWDLSESEKLIGYRPKDDVWAHL
ncbi:NAD(P)-dependent oxidoreductase [Bosea vestrisii]|uniref:NAD-dependent epimerase/dehydratase family protein n=1 Tax=Bosea vestrisii TaxID=151416 RepID=UPI0024DF3642|nr:NAD(P)-dependent oxidoreductase [Bosea vestrisii]WID95091.1 NAD(P)-dependent oxidoreductase [Bosea vestrisii]